MMHSFTRFGICFALFALLGGGVSPAAFAQGPKVHSSHITVDGVQRYFQAGERPIQNITVTNRSDNPIAITVEVLRDYDTPAGKTVKTFEPTEDFIFAPRKFVLPPKANRKVRMVLKEPMTKDNERVYRVQFLPSVPEAGGSLDTIDPVDHIEMGMNMLISTSMIVIVSPSNPEPNLVWERVPEGVYFRNDGNVSVDLRRRNHICYDEAKTDCFSLPGRRLYPGMEWTFETDNTRAFEYWYTIYKGDEQGKVDIPAY